MFQASDPSVDFFKSYFLEILGYFYYGMMDKAKWAVKWSRQGHDPYPKKTNKLVLQLNPPPPPE